MSYFLVRFLVSVLGFNSDALLLSIKGGSIIDEDLLTATSLLSDCLLSFIIIINSYISLHKGSLDGTLEQALKDPTLLLLLLLFT